MTTPTLARGLPDRLCLLALVLAPACVQDSGFTPLTEPEAPAEDTSAPPEEELEPYVPVEPETCPERVYSGMPTVVREDCKTEPPVVRYSPVVEWQWNTWEEFPDADEFNATPVVGQLTDDNEDGLINADDVPDILAVSWNLRPSSPDWVALRLLSGDGTALHWSRAEWWVGEVRLRPIMGASPALGDTDADGVPEIYVVVGPSPDDDGIGYYSAYRGSGVRDCYVARLRPTGELDAVNTEEPVTCLSHQPLLADVQGDGEIDVVVSNETFRTSDLQRIALPPSDTSLRLGDGHAESYWMGGTPVVADLDGDGFLELVTGRHIQEWDGTVRCFTGDTDGWPAVADLDGDGDGEIVIAGIEGVNVLDHTCSLVAAWPLDASGRGGPPTIADYDGDGVPEMGFAAADKYVVYETDGTLKWESPATDYSSNCTGSSVFDFEEDGYAEVVYADETDLWIISGHDGGFVMRWSGHSSWTANEYPIVVDVDGDGEAEIVSVGNSGVTVVGSEEGWAPARQVWNQHAYWITNVNDDLTIPSPTLQNWPAYNSFRSGDLRVNAGQGAMLVDATPFLHDICEVECSEGRVKVAVSASNEGLADAVEGIHLSAYAEQEDGSRVLLDTVQANPLVRAGFALEGTLFELEMADLPTGTLVIVADDDGTGTGTIDECDEDNNELVLEGLCSDD